MQQVDGCGGWDGGQPRDSPPPLLMPAPCLHESCSLHSRPGPNAAPTQPSPGPHPWQSCRPPAPCLTPPWPPRCLQQEASRAGKQHTRSVRQAGKPAAWGLGGAALVPWSGLLPPTLALLLPPEHPASQAASQAPTGDAHGHANVRQLERGCVVHAVACGVGGCSGAAPPFGEPAGGLARSSPACHLTPAACRHERCPAPVHTPRSSTPIKEWLSAPVMAVTSPISLSRRTMSCLCRGSAREKHSPPGWLSTRRRSAQQGGGSRGAE